MECPEWFKYTSLVVVYNGRGEVMLGRRRPLKEEGGKWAIPGGSGAFGQCANPKRFAIAELYYDVSFFGRNKEMDFWFWQRTAGGDEQTSFVIDVFGCRWDGEARANTHNAEAPTEVSWFAFWQVKEMAERGEIAFDNAALLIKLGREGRFA